MSRKRQLVLWGVGGGLVALIVFMLVVIPAWNRGQLSTALRQARLLGMPTNASEFAAQIVPAKPAENAAPFYRQLTRLRGPFDDPVNANAHLLATPDAKSIEAAKSLIAARAAYLKVVEQATARPRCWFDRDWRPGFAVLLPEYAVMKSAANILALRSSVEAQTGDSSRALADVHRIFTVSRHLREEPLEIADAVSLGAYVTGCRELAELSFRYPSERRYYDALNDAVSVFPKIDLRRNLSSDLYGLLSLIDDTSSDRTMLKLGLKPADIPAMNRIPQMFVNPAVIKNRIVAAEIKLWKSLERPPAERASERTRAESDLETALRLNPVAGAVVSALRTLGDPDGIEMAYPANKQIFVAALRALKGSPPPRMIPTSDLPSPADGGPLDYTFDGKSMEIQVSGVPDVTPLVLPPHPRS